MAIEFENSTLPLIVCIYGAYTWGSQYIKKLYKKISTLPEKIEKIHINPLPTKYRKEGDNLLFFNGQQGFLMNYEGVKVYKSILKEKRCVKSVLNITSEELYFLIWCYLFDIIDIKFNYLDNPRILYIEDLINYPYENIKYNGNLTAPISVVWMISKNCPFNCIYCHSDMGNPESKNLEMVKMSQINKILKELKKANVFRIYFSGGEPLANPHFPNILKKSMDMGFYSSFNTNGYLLTPSIAKNLKNYGVKYLDVSINCLGKTFEKITGCDEKINQKVIENLKHCLNIWSSNNINLQIVGTNIAIDNIEETLLHYIKLGFHNFRIVRFIPTYPEMKKYIPSIEDILKLLDIIKKIKKMYKHVNIDVALSPPLCNQYINIPKMLLPLSFWCPAGKSELCILTNGDLIPCISFIRHRSEFHCGNLLKQNILETFHAEKLKNLKDITNSDIRVCKDCKYKNVCYSCRCVSYNWSGSLYNPDYSCHLCNSKDNLNNLFLNNL